MRVLVDNEALEALFQAAEKSHKVLVEKVRGSVRAEPKTEETTKVANYSAMDVVLEAYDPEVPLFAPRKRSATEK